MDTPKSRIFLSCVHDDVAYAKKIYSDLKRFGLHIWFDNEDLLPGQRWELEI